MSSNNLEDIYMEGFLDRLSARAAGAKAGLGAIGRNIGKSFKGGELENISDTRQKAKLQNIIQNFKNEMTKLYGKGWENTYEDLANGLDWTLAGSKLKKPTTPPISPTDKSTTIPPAPTDAPTKPVINPAMAKQEAKLAKAKKAAAEEQLRLKAKANAAKLKTKLAAKKVTKESKNEITSFEKLFEKYCQ